MHVQKVLFVDDDPDIRTIAEMSLRLVGGWEVVVAASGEEGLALARAARPDVVVLDVMMPELDGLSTLARMRGDPDLASIPVVLLTARVGPGGGDAFSDTGAVGLIPKPFDPLELPVRIRALLAGQR